MNLSRRRANARNGARASEAAIDATPDWTVGVVTQTCTGDVVLKMTTEQAAELRDRLIYLMGDGND